MSKYCKAYKLNVTYLDCIECDNKVCNIQYKKEKIKMRKADAKLDIGDIVYYIFGDLKYEIVVKAEIENMIISATSISYMTGEGKVVHAGKNAKLKVGDSILSQNINNNYIDVMEGRAIMGWNAFTSVSRTKEYIKRNKKKEGMK